MVNAFDNFIESVDAPQEGAEETTTKSAHTLGPWILVKTSFNNWLIKTNTSVIVQRIDDEAIARLIASAPELLEVLGWCESAIESGNDEDRDYAARQARLVIAKAKELREEGNSHA